jgi:hypothetical protein
MGFIYRLRTWLNIKSSTHHSCSHFWPQNKGTQSCNSKSTFDVSTTPTGRNSWVHILTFFSCHALEQVKVTVCVLVSFCYGQDLIDSLGRPLTNEAENRTKNKHILSAICEYMWVYVSICPASPILFPSALFTILWHHTYSQQNLFQNLSSQ